MKNFSCSNCEKRSTCTEICDKVKDLIPSMEQGRVDQDDIPSILRGKVETSQILHNRSKGGYYTELQREVVDLYFNENLFQREIAEKLDSSQQAVCHVLKAVRQKAGSLVV